MRLERKTLINHFFSSLGVSKDFAYIKNNGFTYIYKLKEIGKNGRFIKYNHKQMLSIYGNLTIKEIEDTINRENKKINLFNSKFSKLRKKTMLLNYEYRLSKDSECVYGTIAGRSPKEVLNRLKMRKNVTINDSYYIFIEMVAIKNRVLNMSSLNSFILSINKYVWRRNSNRR